MDATKTALTPVSFHQEFHLKRIFLTLLILTLTSICSSAIAQTYEYGHGYIFEQSYVKRISLIQAEKIANIPGLFEPLMSWEWTRGKEEVRDKRIQRDRDRLVIEFGNNKNLSLKNFSTKATKNGDGDSQVFKYIKNISGYYVIGVVYGHDQPQFLLISDSGNHIYFVNTN